LFLDDKYGTYKIMDIAINYKGKRAGNGEWGAGNGERVSFFSV
jgi:hypothetical protein